MKKGSTVKFRTLFWIFSIVSYLLFAASTVVMVNRFMINHALNEAESKSRIILDHSLAIHSYLANDLKLSKLKYCDNCTPKDVFDAHWMSSHYAIRKINEYLKKSQKEDFYFKEASVDARSPDNEADEFEKQFIEDLNKNPKLTVKSGVKVIGGKPFYYTIRRGEEMRPSCLMCHGDPDKAPVDLVRIYGDKLSFHKKSYGTAQVISIRVPLESAYREARRFSAIFAPALLLVFTLFFVVIVVAMDRMILSPIENIRDFAGRIATDKLRLGQQIALPKTKELRDLATSVNNMSSRLQTTMESLEIKIKERTHELADANAILLEEMDIRKKKEEELCEAQEQLYAILNSAPITLFVTDARGVFTLHAGKGIFKTGMKPGDNVGVSAFDLYSSLVIKEHSGEISNGESVINRVLSGEMVAGITELNGVFFDNYFSPIRDVGGRVTGLVGVAIDITDRKRAEVTLQASEVRYRRLFESAKDGVLILDDETGVVQDVNPFLTELLGYSHEKFVGKAVWELGFFKDIVANKDHFEELKRREYIRYEDTPLETADGRKIDVEFVSNVYLVNNERVIQCNIRDITSRKRATEALRKREHLLATVIDNFPGPLSRVDRNLRYLFANSKYEEWFGRTPQSMLGLTIPEVVGEKVFMIAEPYVRRALAGERVSFENPTTNSSGKAFYGLVTYVPDVNPAGNIEGFFTTVTDITNLKRAENELRINSEMQSILNELLREVLSGAPFEEQLGAMLDRIIRIPWLSIQSKGCVFMVGREPGVLEMATQKGMPAHLAKMCAKTPFGECFCGRAAATGETVFVDHVDDRHKKYDGMVEHGHFCVPILSDKVVLGVLNLYLKEGHERLAGEADFLRAAADIFAMVFERKRMEDEGGFLQTQLRQSQKMEAVGRLAGGVAHDFNNMLTVINNYAEFAIASLRPGDPLLEDLKEIHKAGMRSADLTRQLLAFGRKQALVPVVLDVNKVIANLEPMLRRLIGEDVDLLVHLADDIGDVKVDPGQFEQVIMNLAVNSRDAMPKGGKLTIETANVELDEKYAMAHPEATPGQFVAMIVSDTGCGMDNATMEQMFEPFFTTKGVGKGTGLGLSTIYGIVKQSGGNIFVYSEPGMGTTFKIYLPRELSKTEVTAHEKKHDKPTTGTETIIVVEDESGVRNLIKRVLEDSGYTVHTAANGGEALLVCERIGDSIHLLITDIVMPEMSGRELAERLAKICPDMKVLYMSGYTEDAIVRHSVLDPGVNFISKPFSLPSLTAKVRDVLDG